MIPVPHLRPSSATPPSPRLLPKKPSKALFSYSRPVWRAACILLLTTGCLITKGPWTVRTNSPPEEFMINPRDEIRLDNEVQSVIVGFRDDDGDPLFFTWIVDGSPADPNDVTSFIDTNDPLLHYSTYRARRAVLNHGQLVEVIVTDGEDAVRVSWRTVQP